MDNLEFIAYEMACVSEENRSIRKEYYRIKRQYEQLQEEYDSYRRSVEQEKEQEKEREKARKAKKPKEIKLFDVPYELAAGSKVVITDTSAKNPLFTKGFVLQIKSIARNVNGVVTITGEHAWKYDSWKDERVDRTIVSNRYYNWRPVQTDGTSLVIHHSGWNQLHTYERLIEV